MKRVHYIIVLAAAMLISVYLCSADDVTTVLSKEQLPQTAQTFIDTHFADEQIVSAIKETEIDETEYKVKMNGGKEIEFYGNGDWKTVDCIDTAVPDAIVPKQITVYVKLSAPKALIVKIKKESDGWEVDLNTGANIEFNKKFQPTDLN